MKPAAIRLALISLTATTWACDEPALAPLPPSAAVIVTVGATWLSLDPEDGRVLWSAATGDWIEQAVLAPDGRTILAGYGDATGARTLAALDAGTGRTLWTQALSVGWVPRIQEGIGLLAGSELAFRPDGEAAYLWHATLGDTVGIALVDLATRRPLAFSGPWNVGPGGLVPLPPAAGGHLVLVAWRETSPLGQAAAIHLLDPVTLQPVDSMFAADVGIAGGNVWGVVPGRDGPSLYVAGRTRLVRFDLPTRSVTAGIPRAAMGTLTIAPDGTLVLTDVGWSSESSGRIRLYDEQLELTGTIDVGAAIRALPGPASDPVMGPAHFSADGRTLYVRTGSPDPGLIHPPQPARLLVIDLPTRSVRRILELGGYGNGALLVPR